MMNEPPRANGLSVLVIDHDFNEQKALVIGLRLEGFQADGASSSASALEALAAGRFDVALIDLMVPETNGLQLSRMIRARFPEVTTILMSAYHLSLAQLVRANTGAVGFVPKPFRFDDLVQFVRVKAARSPSTAPAPFAATAPDSGLHTPFELPRTA
ncbi:MAG: response regulator [Proteobacteria bacterium]|jgi:DNA-binding response OmpR family regulator|nr:response regulator [Pseudomonadota bacterium]